MAEGMNVNIKSAIGKNVRVCREAAGLSQDKFAVLLKVSRQTLSAIENGKVAPDSARLLDASHILGCPVSDFFREQEESVALLFRAAEHVIPSQEIRSRFQKLSQAYRELEEIVGVAETSISPPEYSFYPEAHSKSASFAVEVARSERERLGLGQKEPIENIFKLLEENGVRILFDEILQDGVSGISGFSRKYGPCILVKESETLERNIFTVAHEYGHLLMHRYLYQSRDAGIAEQDGDIERMAHEFAAAFLVPEFAFRETLAKDVGKKGICLEDVVYLKHHFRVSAEVILRRIESFAVADKQQCADLRAKITKEESDPTHEYRPIRSEQLVEWRTINRFVHLQRKAVLEEMISIGRLAELLGKSVLEARLMVKDWRRNPDLVTA